MINPRRRQRLTGREAALRFCRRVQAEASNQGASSPDRSNETEGPMDAGVTAGSSEHQYIRTVGEALLRLRGQHTGTMDSLIAEVDRRFPDFVKRYPKLTCMLVQPHLSLDSWQAKVPTLRQNLTHMLSTAADWQASRLSWDDAEAHVAQHLAQQYIRPATETGDTEAPTLPVSDPGPVQDPVQDPVQAPSQALTQAH